MKPVIPVADNRPLHPQRRGAHGLVRGVRQR